MKTELTKNEDLTADISIVIEPEDYSSQFDSELKKLRSTVNIRGFRKGRTPKSFLMKRYGESVLYDIINKKLNEGLSQAVEDSEDKFLGGPLVDESNEAVSIDPTTKKNYEFNFKIGIAPDVDVAGLDEPFEWYDVEVDDEKVTENLDQLRNQEGKSINVEDEFQGNDLVTFNAREMEGDEIRSDGLETTFDILIDDIPEEDIKNQILKSKLGDKLVFDIYKISDVQDEDFVRKYLMNLEEDDADLEVNPMFEGEIVEVTRHMPADLDEEFLKKYFGEEVTTEDEAKEKILENLKEQYDAQADQLLNHAVRERVMEKTDFALPDEFMKRWFLNDARDREQEISEEEMDTHYEETLRDGLKWQLIMEEWEKKYEIEVESKEIVERAQNQILQYLPPQNVNQEILENFMNQILSDKEQVAQYRNEVFVEKMFRELKKDLQLEKNPISIEDFMKVMEAKQKELQKNADESFDLEEE